MTLAALFVLATPTPSSTPTPPSVAPAGGPILEAPASLNPSDLDWWWQYGLDGVVGGLIGGAATGVVLWLTIRHERRAVRMSELRQAAGRLLAMAARLEFRAARSMTTSEWSDWLADFLDASTGTSARATNIDPLFAKQLMNDARDVRREFDVPSADQVDRDKLMLMMNATRATVALWLGTAPD